MKRLINFLLLLCLSVPALAQTDSLQKAPYERTRTNQVISDYGSWSRYFMGIPKGPAPVFPAWVPDSVKCGAMFYNTTDNQLYYYSCASNTWLPEGAGSGGGTMPDAILNQKTAAQNASFWINGNVRIDFQQDDVGLTLSNGLGTALAAYGHNYMGNAPGQLTDFEIEEDVLVDADFKLRLADAPVGTTDAVNLGYLQSNYAHISGGGNSPVVQVLTATANGTTTVTIPHGLTGITSSSAVMVFENGSNSFINGATVDATNVYVVFSKPLTSGTTLTYTILIRP